MTDLNALAAANAARWDNARLMRDFGVVARRLVSPPAKARYQLVSAETGVPWAVIAVIHLRADFQHLRRWRKSVEQAQSYTFKAVITVIVAGFLGAVWLGVKVVLGK